MSAPPAAPRVALVTGAARRLGREIALALARAGWDIGLHYGGSRDDAEAMIMAARVKAGWIEAPAVEAEPEAGEVEA